MKVTIFCILAFLSLFYTVCIHSVNSNNDEVIEDSIKAVRKANSFSLESLKDSSKYDTVYEILISDNTGEFKVSENPEIQSTALKDYIAFLYKACTFKGMPFSGCKIRNIGNGKLQLQDDRWIITEKALIEFI